MIKRTILTIAACLTIALTMQGQDVFGHWKTIDDETGEPKSVVEIYQEDGKVYGKIVELIDPERPDPICEECSGADKDAPILGLVIIKGLSADGAEYNGGKILDPKSGKLYKCYISLEEDDTLKVRGFVGFSLLGRTQYWVRDSR